MAGKRVFGGAPANPNASPLSSLLHKQDSACSTSQPLHALFISPASSAFLGSGSMVSFADTKGGKWGGTRSLFGRFGDDEIGEDDMEEYLQQPEKKRRLSAEQVQSLERTFELENKLEPDRKIQLAEDLNLQPRQVAIWFQNRRARWKTKQLEKDYESLEASFNSLKANYDNLVKEKDRLKAEVANLKEKMLLREKTDKLQEKCVFDSASVKQENMVSSAKSDMLEHCDSSYAFEVEADQSEESQDEQDNMNSSSLFPLCIFPRLEDVECYDPPQSSCHLGFEEDDHAFWYWSY